MNNLPLQAGSHQVQYQPQRLKAGMFYVVLQAGKDIQTKKMVLME